VGGWLFGHQIEVYHAINVLLYGLNALLLYGFVRHLVARPYALVAALLFVSRAAHVEVITNTVEFQVLLATFFALTALYLFAVALRQKRPWLVGVVYFLALLALFSKEAAIAIVALLPLYGWLFARPWQWSYLVGPLLVGASWLVLFVTALHLVNQDQATGFHFTVSPNTVVRNMTAHLWSFSNYFVGDESDPVLPPLVQIVANSVAGQGLLLLLGIGTFLLLVGKNHILPLRHLVAFGGAFFLLTVLPYSFFDDRLFIRYGYFSHAGLSIATAAAVALAVAQVKSFWRHRIKDYATVASA
jgi:4-amino-4-deoxy-L-arabinose transferase-like glycosyltransferase